MLSAIASLQKVPCDQSADLQQYFVVNDIRDTEKQRIILLGCVGKAPKGDTQPCGTNKTRRM